MGETRAELRRYHDLAASTKTRGKGIGFAGVGIKLGLLACDEVLTETRRGKSHVATSWQLTSRHRAVLPNLGGSKRPAHAGLVVEFESRPDDPSLGRLVEYTIWVNETHPAYRRAAASRAEEYHVALTVAMTLAPLAVEPGHLHQFVTTFLERWGSANGAAPAGAGLRARTPRHRSGRRDHRGHVAASGGP